MTYDSILMFLKLFLKDEHFFRVVILERNLSPEIELGKI